MEVCFALRGQIAYTPTREDFAIAEDSWLVCEDGKVAGVFGELPERYAAASRYDLRGCLLIPGLCDLHTHAPQFAYRGLGMDLELLDWLRTRAYPEESRYRDPGYAALAYGQFADALRRSATTRACVFATMHTEATLTLMRLLDESGLVTLVGKVGMDRNAPDALLDPPGKPAIELYEAWIRRASVFTRAKPIVTPRFVPSCTDGLMKGLGEIKRRYGLPVQSHLCENLDEVKWVRDLCPDADNYLHAYARWGLVDSHTVMAHCVYPEDDELRRMRDADMLVCHCPASNANLASGVAPVRRYLDAGVRVALGTDVAGGQALSMFRAVTDAVQVSKLRARFGGMAEKPVTLSEAFYMATKGGGSFFGKVGSFEPGYAFDALALDDGGIASPGPLAVRERLERALYLERDTRIRMKFVDGRPVCL